MISKKCIICGFDKYTEKHKLSLIPEKEITVCPNCHKRIKHEKGFHDDLRPKLSKELKEIPRKETKINDEWKISYRYEGVPEPNENIIYEAKKYQQLDENEIIKNPPKKEIFTYIIKNDKIKFLDNKNNSKVELPFEEETWNRIPKYLRKETWEKVRRTMKTKEQQLKTQKDLRETNKDTERLNL